MDERPTAGFVLGGRRLLLVDDEPSVLSFSDRADCADGPVTVVGGGNGAGQAALCLASWGCDVTVAIRRPEIESGMSRYPVDRLLANPKIIVRGGTEVTRLEGEQVLESISIVGPTGEQHEQACNGLFCFIGAEPATNWLTGVALDEHGFVRTDVQLTTEELGKTWAALGGEPLPFETSVPGVFAVGDVRHGSMKRVAAAVGEGASAVRSVHTAIGVRAQCRSCCDSTGLRLREVLGEELRDRLVTVHAVR